MNDVVIRVENLSKQYRLGEIGTGSIAHDINRWWNVVRGKDDPYLKIGEINDRTVKSTNEYVWALRDINFEIGKGEAVGIIGRNGAGKSTLLKILSRTTTPTKGRVKLKGRVASLLEVGTGFHPDLSGRENIYLNGAILGMRKQEITRKFDEIVDFAGVERYIDTPVKRYSSGMYVRLAFGVAAHLEPEILIVDEVLAVGDAEFQRKCLGKMQDVSKNNGRTVIFVSHNMTAIKTLCHQSIWIENGSIKLIGETNKTVDSYLIRYLENTNSREIDYSNSQLAGNENVKFITARIESKNEIIRVDMPISVYLEFECFIKDVELNLSLVMYTKDDVCVLNTASGLIKGEIGRYYARCYLPSNYLNDEFYRLRVLIVKNGTSALIDVDNIISFQVEDIERDGNWFGKWVGVVRPDLDWELGNKY